MPGLLAALLVVCAAAAAAAAAAAPAPSPSPAPEPPLPPPAVCPGIAGGACTRPCQLVTCRALHEFFDVMYNKSLPWLPASGASWTAFRAQPCAASIPAAPPPGSPPPYCDLYGVACCAAGAAGRAAGCGAAGSVASIAINADNVNGSISNPLFLGAFDQLHACGLTGLDLESNYVSGRLSPIWGRFTNLTVLKLGARPPRAGGGAWDAARGRRGAAWPAVLVCSPRLPFSRPHTLPPQPTTTSAAPCRPSWATSSA
jgi:hypothetical protein